MDMIPATLIRVTLDSPDMLREGHRHEIRHDSLGPVLIQLYDREGKMISPSSTPAYTQTMDTVRIHVLHESYYPVTVVMVG